MPATTHKAASFQYNVLSFASNIRVLTLLPATNFRAKIYCTVKEVNLNDRPQVKYEALSYVWGDPKLTKVIHVGEASASTQIFHPFNATWNLEAALRHLRCKDKERVIWIDAVCINQEDQEEKENQVQMMGQIYASADHVILWLGSLVEEDHLQEIWFRPGNFSSKINKTLWRCFDRGVLTMLDYGRRELLALRWLQRLNQEQSRNNSSGEVGVGNDRPFFRILRVLSGVFSSEAKSRLPSQRILGALFDFLTRQWFSRVWVIQEVVLATKKVTVQCGRETLPLEVFMASHEYLSTSNMFRDLDRTSDFPIPPPLIPNSRVHVLASAYSRFKSPRFSSLPVPDKVIEALLDVGFCLDTSNPHDTLYGMIGMINVTQDIPILKPDYNKPIADFMAELVRYLIESTGTLKILQGGYGRRPLDVKKIVPNFDVSSPADKKLSEAYTTSKIPSWVPSGKMRNFRQSTIYQSSDSLRRVTSFHFSDDGRSINITIHSLGSISWVTPHKNPSNKSPRSFYIRSHVRNTILASQQAVLINEAVLKRYGSSTAIAKHLLRIYSNDSEVKTIKDVKNFEIWLNKTERLPGAHTNETREYIETMRDLYYDEEYISSFEVFVTSEGYLGRIIREGNHEILFRNDWRELIDKRELETKICYVPGCAYPLLVGRFNSLQEEIRGGGGGGGVKRWRILATCAVVDLLGLGVDEHIAMFENREELENLWID